MLDEPTTYLDIGACHDVMRLVRRLNVEENKTVVMVIHDLDLVSSLFRPIGCHAGRFGSCGGRSGPECTRRRRSTGPSMWRFARVLPTVAGAFPVFPRNEYRPVQ